MPTREDILGFSNRWYALAIETAETRTVAGLQVRIVTPALFVATKLEAFRGRGRGDMVTSHDLEDIVTVVDGRPELVNEIEAGTPRYGTTSQQPFVRRSPTRTSSRRCPRSWCRMLAARRAGHCSSDA